MKTSKGFTVIEGLLILVIVGILGFTGWFVWHSKNSTDTSAKNANAVNSSTPTKQSEDASAAQTVLQFYGKYNGLSLSNEHRNLVKQYGTDKLVSYFDNNQLGTDPIDCAQMDGTISIDSHSLSGTTSTVVVKEVFDTNTLKIVVKVVNQNGLKIDSITCPTALPTAAP